MRMNSEDLVLVIALLYGCTLVSAKTSPEFSVTVDTEYFKEIRIPLNLWKQIIGFTYASRPYTKITNGTEEEIVDNAVDIANELAIDVVVPADGLNPEAALQQAAIPERPIPSEVEIPPPEGEGIVDGLEESEVTNPGSVLVQTSKRPCTCEKGVCSCCSTFFRQSTCAKIGFIPDEFSIDVKMTMNDRVIASRKMPIRDPPPFCFTPRRYEFLDVCLRLNNIHYKNRNLNMCIDVDTGIAGFDLYSWNYNCLRFGTKGLETGLSPEIVTKKPSRPQSSGLFTPLTGSDDDEDDDDDDDDDDIGGFFDFF